MKQLITTLAVFSVIMVSCKKNKPDTAPTAPLVTTAALSNVNIGAGSATAGGSIVSDGGAIVTKSGIVWSPSNNTPILTADSIATGTTTTGAFTININGLDFGKSYYFRAFATNSIGTGYGDVVTLTTSSDSVRFTYNGQSVTYGIITSSASGKKWLDRNLGAKQVASAYNDWQAYGDLFQWGRPADGHQLIIWTANASESSGATAANGTTTTLATSDMPGNPLFISPIYDPATWKADWRSDNNRNRWATIPKGPCPNGWHVPSVDEWLAEVSMSAGGTANSGGMTDRSTAYTLFKLTVGGAHTVDGNGAVTFSQVGRVGHYWTSTDRNNAFSGYTDARDFVFGTTGAEPRFDFKANAKSVRCIKDN